LEFFIYKTSLQKGYAAFRSGRFGLGRFGLSRFGLADAVWPFQSRDFSVSTHFG